MFRHPVNSSRMLSVGWENGIMEIEFNNHAIYQYYNVSEAQYQAFIASPSLGQELQHFQKLHPYDRIS